MLRGPERLAINSDRVVEHLRCEMGCEGVGQAEHCRELGAEQARPEDPKRNVQALAGNGPHSTARPFEIALQFQHVVGELVLVGVEVSAQRKSSRLVRARRSPEPQVDPAGEQRLQRAELLGDGQRRMVRKHDPACADADGGRLRANVG